MSSLCWRGLALLLVLLLPRSAAAQPDDRFVTVNGLRIHYLDWGSPGKPPMILLHGIARVAHTFDHQAARLKNDYHVIAVDMRGHGDSAWDPNGAYLVEDYVKDIEGLVGALKLRNLVMWGNSTGGRVAQVFAGLHPELMAALIVEDVGPERPSSIANNFARQVQQDAGGWASEDELFQQLKRGSRVSDEQLKTYIQFATKPAGNGRIVWKRDPKLANGFVVTELWQYVQRIKCPTIYVIGGGSDIVPIETQRRLKDTLPDVEIVTMPKLGHYPSEESPDAFRDIVTGFLAAKVKH